MSVLLESGSPADSAYMGPTDSITKIDAWVYRKNLQRVDAGVGILFNAVLYLASSFFHRSSFLLQKKSASGRDVSNRTIKDENFGLLREALEPH